MEQPELNSAATYLDGLLPALQRLDQRLERAVAIATSLYGADAAGDLYRGLYVSPRESERLLNRQPGVPLFSLDEGQSALPDPLPESSRLVFLEHAYNLSPFDVDVLLVALAPELDRRYERLYAYLQDHVSRRYPSIDLVLSLLCSDAVERIERRTHFDVHGPLIRHNLIHLLPELNQDCPSLLAHYLKLDDQIVRFLLHQEGLDARLAPFCELVVPSLSLDGLPFGREIAEVLPALKTGTWVSDQLLRLYFQGPPGVGKFDLAEALAGEADTLLLRADLMRALAEKTEFKHLLTILFREAWFQDAILYLEGLDTLRSDEHIIAYGYLLDALAEYDGITILAGSQPWVPSTRHSLGVHPVRFSFPNFSQRREIWQTELAAVGVVLEASELDALAGRYRLMPSQITEAIATACSNALWHSVIQPSSQDFMAAARTQSGHELMTLARKITPIYTWDDIVLPEDSYAQLREICQRVIHRHKVLDEWGFDRKLSLGKGINVLFAGASGTGKTMAAEILANALNLDLYKIDLSGVVSKYIGETEKNLDRIFAAAENANAILLFDEADALFGKRSEVRDSHDRYANIEISYLLQKMEEYDGISILSTNMRQNLDDAFIRRMTFSVHFPFPDEESRRMIWAGIWPVEVPIDDDVDLSLLAREFRLAGGNIKNIALAAAFLAAEENSHVTMAHIQHAVRREYQKMGKQLK